MEVPRNVLLDSTLDLVTFFDIFKDDMQDEIDHLAADLERCAANNDDVEIIHTGSGFEQLSLPHIENFRLWNTDADHMIIRTDIKVKESSKGERTKPILAETERTQQDATSLNVQVNGIANSKPTDLAIEDINGNTDAIEENGCRKSVIVVENCNDKSVKFTKNFPDEEESKPLDTAEGNSNQATDANHNNQNIVYIYDGSHPGYVLISNEILQHPIDSESIKKQCQNNSKFIESCREIIPLSRTILMATDEGKVTGPSYSMYYNGGTFNLNRDFVYGLKCKFWPLQAQEWIHRQRPHGWPKKELISTSVSQGCHVVPVGSHNSDLREFEWRISFSVVELKLAHSLTDNQKLSFSILKAIIKNEMKRRKIEVFASYHLKTTLFWFLEKRDWKILEGQSLATNILEILDFFIDFYASGVLPNYFIPKNNMIDHRSSEEIRTACVALREIKSEFTMSLCRYIEANQALPVFFDVPLTQLLIENSEKFLQLCKYNFLVMALAYMLMRMKKAKDPVSNGTAGDVVYKLVQKASLQPKLQNSASDEIHLSDSVPTTTSVLRMIEQSIEKDKMKVTESSAVILAVFNLFLALHPTPMDRIGFPVESTEFHNYLTNPAFVECLAWAGRLHEKHCDVIYDFVVKKWVNGPNFHTTDEQAEKLLKLLMVMLGMPTKQARAVTGSLLKRNIDGERFLVLRSLAVYLLQLHLECSYVAFQACGYLMDKQVISEIYSFVKWGSYSKIKLRALELILSKEELQAQLSEKDFDKLVQLQYELTAKDGQK